jgi:arginine decarboxylase
MSPPGWPETPVADALLRLRARHLTSFHGLPIATDPEGLPPAYAELLGPQVMGSDLAVTGPAFDSFFFPTRVIARAEQLAAQAFGAHHSLFVTAGTSMAIQIAIEAMVEPGARVLADRRCHQSVHLALNRVPATVSYATSLPAAPASERCAVDAQALVEACRGARREGRPFAAVVLTAASYDGVLLHLERLLATLWDIDPDLQVLADEAWSAHACFHPALRPHSAMAAAARIAQAGGRTGPLVSVQSAHKTLNALRQGSFLHSWGDAGAAARLRSARFALHTTSPSYPIMASLDLARAQMQHEGRQLVARALGFAQALRERLATDPAFSAYRVNGDEEFLARGAGLVGLDLTRVSLDVSGLGICTQAFKRILLARHGLFLHRSTASSVLLNLHIGIGAPALDRLLQALADVQSLALRHAHRRRRSAARERASGPVLGPTPGDGGPSSDFLIPYPPGVPAVVPGEPLDGDSHGRLSAAAAAGAEVIRLRGRASASTMGHVAPPRGEEHAD